MLLKTSFRNTKGDETTRKRKIKLKKAKLREKMRGDLLTNLGRSLRSFPSLALLVSWNRVGSTVNIGNG